MSHKLDRQRELEFKLEGALKVILTQDRLPDLAEVEPGALLHLVRETWPRDGRAGHLTDAKLAALMTKAIETSRAPGGGEDYDRNKFQLQFGNGKKVGGVHYQQPVQQAMAEAYLHLALEKWSVAPGTSGDDAQYEPFRGWDAAMRGKVVEKAIGLLYPEDGKPVFTRPQVGRGPQDLYRELGQQGYSVVVAARREAVSITRPEQQVFEFAELLRLLLEPNGNRSETQVHVWAFRAPDSPSATDRAAELRRITSLREMLTIVQALNDDEALEKSGEWKEASLKRCVVAVLGGSRKGKASGDPQRIFSDDAPGTWVPSGAGGQADIIPIFARNPQGAVHVFSFAGGPDPSASPFISGHDPGDALKEEVARLEALAQAFVASGDPRKVAEGWTLYTVKEFVGEIPVLSQGDLQG